MKLCGSRNHRFTRSPKGSDRAARGAVVAAIVLLLASAAHAAEPKAPAAQAQSAAATAQIARGKYLVAILGCNDCHTPLIMGPNGPEPDMKHMLAGHPAGMVMPPPPKLDMSWMWAGSATNTAFVGPWGTSYAINLTPHPVTGLAEVWTEELFIKAMRTGRHIGTSRMIMPPMPWTSYTNMTDEDLRAVFAFIKSVPPVDNLVPDAVEAPAPTH